MADPARSATASTAIERPVGVIQRGGSNTCVGVSMRTSFGHEASNR